MLVFVFAQDFFTQTESMTGPTIEQLRIYGYDFRDVADNSIENHTGALCLVEGTLLGDLDDGDVVAIYVRNHGNLPVFVESIRIFGSSPTTALGVSGTPVTMASGGTPVPDTNEWTLNVVDDCDDGEATAPIQPAAEATILVGWDNDYVLLGNTDGTKVGRPVFVTITTDAGNVFTKTIINGRSVG